MSICSIRAVPGSAVARHPPCPRLADGKWQTGAEARHSRRPQAAGPGWADPGHGKSSFDLLRRALLAMDAAPDPLLVMDHMPSLDPAPESRQLYESLTQVIHKDEKGDIITAPHARLDQLMAAFGEDRVMFGRPTACEPRPSRKPYR
jgi:hypothetical protein